MNKADPNICNFVRKSGHICAKRSVVGDGLCADHRKAVGWKDCFTCGIKCRATSKQCSKCCKRVFCREYKIRKRMALAEALGI